MSEHVTCRDQPGWEEAFPLLDPLPDAPWADDLAVEMTAYFRGDGEWCFPVEEAAFYLYDRITTLRADTQVYADFRKNAASASLADVEGVYQLLISPPPAPLEPDPDVGVGCLTNPEAKATDFPSVERTALDDWHGREPPPDDDQCDDDDDDDDQEDENDKDENDKDENDEGENDEGEKDKGEEDEPDKDEDDGEKEGDCQGADGDGGERAQIEAVVRAWAEAGEEGGDGEEGEDEGEGKEEGPSEDAQGALGDPLDADVASAASIMHEMDLDSVAPRMSPGEPRSATAEETLRELQRMYPKLAQVLAIVGRVAATGHRGRPVPVPGGVGEVRGVIQGDDMSKVVPISLMRMKDPVLKRLMLRDIVEGNMDIYEHRSQQPAGLGPAVIAIDVSPSMGYPIGKPPLGYTAGQMLHRSRSTTRADVAAGTVIGMVRALHRQRRHVTVIPFGSRAGSPIVLPPSMASDEVTKILMRLTLQVIDGTSFEAAIRATATALRSAPKADVVVITDGEAEEPTTQLPKDTRMTLVQIGSSSSGLRRRADHVVPIREVDDGFELGEIVTASREKRGAVFR